MRRSADLLVFASGDAIGEEGTENSGFGCDAARRINSCIGVFRSDRLREYRNLPGAGVSLVGLRLGGSSSWAEALCFGLSLVGSALEIIEIDIKLTRNRADDSGSAASNPDLWSPSLHVCTPSS